MAPHQKGVYPYLFQKLLYMANHTAPIEFLESVLAKIEADPEIRAAEGAMEGDIMEKHNLHDSKMREKINDKLRVYRELYFDLLD